MTTVAWDGVTLAGDSQWMVGSTRVGGSPKVRRLTAPNGRRVLFGFAGDSAYMQAYLHWLAGGAQPTASGGSWQILMIDEERDIYYRHDGSPYWDRFGRRPCAIGNGTRYAVGAMAAGADAVQAVKIARRLDTDTGGRIRAVRF